MSVQVRAEQTTCDAAFEASTGLVQIIKVPEGGAPEWVRDAWLGLFIPALPTIGIPAQPPYDVVTGKQTKRGHSCWVPQREALLILHNSGAEGNRAWQWWSDHGYPQSTFFLFNLEEVKIISGVTVQPVRVVDELDGLGWEDPDR